MSKDGVTRQTNDYLKKGLTPPVPSNANDRATQQGVIAGNKK